MENINESKFMPDSISEELFKESTINPENKDNSLNEGFNNKNYVFNNCSVTINEEGKAIQVLQEQKRQEAKTQDIQMKMLEGVVSMIGSAVSSLVVTKIKTSNDAYASKTEPVSVKKETIRKKASTKKILKKK